MIRSVLYMGSEFSTFETRLRSLLWPKRERRSHKSICFEAKISLSVISSHLYLFQARQHVSLARGAVGETLTRWMYFKWIKMCAWFFKLIKSKKKKSKLLKVCWCNTVYSSGNDVHIWIKSIQYSTFFSAERENTFLHTCTHMQTQSFAMPAQSHV